MFLYLLFVKQVCSILYKDKSLHVLIDFCNNLWLIVKRYDKAMFFISTPKQILSKDLAI